LIRKTPAVLMSMWVVAADRSSRPRARRWHQAPVVVAALLALAATPAGAQLSSRPIRSVVTDGPVDAVAVRGGRVFFDGSFDAVGPRTGPGVLLRRDTGQRLRTPEISGGAAQVWAAASDQHGGFYVAGSFSRVGSVRAANVLHLLADGRVERRFHAGTDGSVRALALRGHRLFLGGYFGRIDGHRRLRIGAVDARTGRATGWDARLRALPGNKTAVHALQLGHGVLYAGGTFLTARGVVRRNLAALRLSDARPTGFDAHLHVSFQGVGNGLESVLLPTRALALSVSTLYVGGDAVLLEAVNARTGSKLPWRPRLADGQVRALAVSGGAVIVGGRDLSYPTGAESDAETVLVGVDRRDGAVVPSLVGPQVNRIDSYTAGFATVSALAVDGDRLYVGGEFGRMGGQLRHALAEVNVTDGAATDWNPRPNGPVVAVAAAGGTVFAGGSFSSVVGSPAAALPRSTCTAGCCRGRRRSQASPARSPWPAARCSCSPPRSHHPSPRRNRNLGTSWPRSRSAQAGRPASHGRHRPTRRSAR
jgi:hypothetical protein